MGRNTKRGEKGRNKTVRIPPSVHAAGVKAAKQHGFASLTDFVVARVMVEAAGSDDLGRLRLAAELDASQQAHLYTARQLAREAAEKQAYRTKYVALASKWGIFLKLLREQVPPEILARLPMDRLRPPLGRPLETEVTA